MEVHPLLGQLDKLLAEEGELVGRGPLALPHQGISPGMRDGSAHVLRCLKVWFELPTDVFHTATANIDTFLAKMKAQPKHLSCIAVAAFHLACNQYKMEFGCSVPDPQTLVNISQSRCSASDLTRMEGILAAKLGDQTIPALPVTCLSFIRSMWEICRAASDRLEISPTLPSLPQHLLHQLEILVCDSSTMKVRSCELALALLCTEFQRIAGSEKTAVSAALMGFITELQKYCGISTKEFIISHTLVLGILDKYNGDSQVPHRQRLVWKLSNRTLKHLRPTDKLRPTLPRISEESLDRSAAGRFRSASECSLESLSDSDNCRTACSDSESDMEMEEPRTWAKIVATN
ncbi:cyclin G [Eurytemora carolleeae]|uniref:cyclin G n=1 Tax=Eurytemora carolleeae TaxID=1294199 RepID=UPI000C77F4B0|nr:cyclin G [Eurytemora carolleeae]XP_023336530.1 cyclin G [Eurytemora carolleeae]XP_023336531.1 cyclin G [Eurytemora carolleeae]|eukprot:XP_023336528.1 cyclin G-like [Eurytemora affinis]